MKRTLIAGYMVLSSLVIATVTAHAQTEEEQTLKLIRHWYKITESHDKLQKTVIKTGEDEEPHGVTVTRYARGSGELKKLHVVAGGEHGGEEVTYYFNSGKLYFVYVAYESWVFTGEENADGLSETMTTMGQRRYYFLRDKCFRALEKVVRSKDGGQLAERLKKMENKPIKDRGAAAGYVERAKLLSAVKNKSDLEKFLSRRD